MTPLDDVEYLPYRWRGRMEWRRFLIYPDL